MDITSFGGIKKGPSLRRRASEWIAVRMTTGRRWHDYLHPAPRYPDGIQRDYRYQGFKYSIVKTPRRFTSNIS